jgi:hypothetical protein
MSTIQLTELDPGASRASGLWTWASPDAPIRVGVDLEMVARLRKELEKASNEGEAGGVLLGHANKSAATLEIHGFVLLPPDPESAGDYRLDFAQLERLRREHGDLTVVGYFRTQEEGALHLRRPELNLVAMHFSESTDVVMLIRTTPRHAFRAGFLFWDKGSFVPFSVQDFPLDAAALAHDETANQRMSFVPMMESQAPEFKPRVEIPFAGTQDVPLRIPRKPPVRNHRNAIAMGAAVAGVIALSAFLLRNSFPWESKPVPTETTAAEKVAAPAPPPAPAASIAAPIANVAAQPKTIVAPQLKTLVPPRVTTPPRAAPPVSTPKTPSSTAPRASGIAPVAPDGRAPAQQLPTPQPAASQPKAAAIAAEDSPAPQPIVPLAPPPDLTAREQAPATTTAASTSAPTPATTTPAPHVEAAAAKTTPPAVAPKPAPPKAPSRFVGAWSYPLNDGLYHGSQPEVVEIVIQETNGRLSGTAYARFKSSPTEPSRTLRFQFGGDLRAGRTQAFGLDTVDGTRGTVELIPGTSPNLLELNFRTAPENGSGQTGNMILVKR